MERWRPVKGYEGVFEVSNMGNIRSFTRIVKRSGNRGDLTVKGRLMRTPISKHYGGYKAVCFNYYDDDGKRRVTHKLVHRIVAEAFIPNPENKPEVNHIDGNKLNCCVENLEWVTRKENARHAQDTGLYVQMKGEKHGKHKLTESDVLAIRKLISDGVVMRVIAEQFNVAIGTIANIKHKRNWAWL